MKYGYGSHLPTLLEYVMKTDGAILEIGAGNYSTPILHMYNDRRIITLENNVDWLNKFIHYNSDSHILTSDTTIIDTVERYSVVLVDSTPSKDRNKWIERLASRSDYLVCHDWGYSKCNYINPYRRWGFVKLYTELLPWTMVLGKYCRLEA